MISPRTLCNVLWTPPSGSCESGGKGRWSQDDWAGVSITQFQGLCAFCQHPHIWETSPAMPCTPTSRAHTPSHVPDSAGSQGTCIPTVSPPPILGSQPHGAGSWTHCSPNSLMEWPPAAEGPPGPLTAAHSCSRDRTRLGLQLPSHLSLHGVCYAAGPASDSLSCRGPGH